MISSFRHKGLKRFFESGDGREIRADLQKRVRRILGLLEAASTPEEIDVFPGLKLHRLKGDLAGFFAVSVSGNWRIIFRFADGEFQDVDLLDDH